MKSDGSGVLWAVHIKTSGSSWRTHARGYMKYRLPLPIKHRGEELGDEPLVIWAERLSIDRLVAFAVQIVRVERAYCGQRTLVLFIREV
jgi:hypothetical protein